MPDDSTRRANQAIFAIAVAKVALHALTSARGHGVFSDEFYYLACAARLDWGYVDHPPLSVAILTAWTSIFGDSLASIRMAPALIGGASVFAAGLLARELGGRIHAQILTALIVALAPVNLVVHGFYSMNAVDGLVWGVLFVAIARLVREPTPGRWVMLGVLFGLGLMNKYSVAWLGAGFGIGLLVTPHRRLLASPWPWLAGLIALVIFAPHLYWQWANGFPTAEFVAAATANKMLPVGPIDLFAQQALVMHPITLPLWVGGFILLVRGAHLGRNGPERIFAAVFVTTVVILIINGTSRPNYLALAQPPLVAAGAIGLERLAERSGRGWLNTAAISTMVLLGLLMSVLTLPILAPADMARLSGALGIGAPQMQHDKGGALDQHFAEMIGWDVIVEAVAEVWLSLPEAERRNATIVASNYGEAGAIEYYGPAHGLPTPVSAHNNYWLWGPGRRDATVFVIVAGDAAGLSEFFGRIEERGTWDCGYCLPSRNHRKIFIARDPLLPIDVIWSRIRHYQ